ncbi:AraC family transcriptional regulator [Clostridium aestuarii]|uniref:AraC family transcriptional regulator n=1 Tax=Clostridium aestuarii TaxID=338193 RepID=A0ABT4CXV0_9CLOT|nr:AraC family transcriptional regulator [Clostridium aestuarii]MCY6483810.1 AraC family transcriptional regulator [Clostridium aestuarii]
MCKNQWFEEKSKLIEENKDYFIYRYSCNGSGILTVYKIFDGIEIVFMNFNTYDTFIPDTPHKDIIEISWCKKGRVECEFTNQSISYLQEGDFGINGSDYVPVSYQFPLGIYEAVSLVVNQRECSDEVRKLMKTFSIDIDSLFCHLDLKRAWYISRDDKKLKHLFNEIYVAKKKESNEYFAIKSIELLYHIRSLSEFTGKKITYYKKEQIKKVKKIRDYLVNSLDEKISIEQCAVDNGIGITTFRSIFLQIYGDIPTVYLKKYKMAVATKFLLDKSLSIMNIALQLGYSNPSKFSAAFKKEYGMLPKDYKKKNEDSGYFEEK